MPFLAVDLKERFAYPVPFSDKEKFALSAKQRERFLEWLRPENFIQHPCVIAKIDFATIKQVFILQGAQSIGIPISLH